MSKEQVKGGLCGWLINGSGGFIWEPCERHPREEPL